MNNYHYSNITPQPPYYNNQTYYAQQAPRPRFDCSSMQTDSNWRMQNNLNSHQTNCNYQYQQNSVGNYNSHPSNPVFHGGNQTRARLRQSSHHRHDSPRPPGFSKSQGTASSQEGGLKEKVFILSYFGIYYDIYIKGILASFNK